MSDDAQAMLGIGDSQDGNVSFEARMQKRRVQREQRTTEIFEVPGFEDLFKVEMQVVGYKRLADIALANQRQRDDALKTLAIAAEQIIAATAGFYKIQDDGSLARAEGATWQMFARAFDPSLDQTVKPRVALVRLLEGQGVLTLHSEWYIWNGRGSEEVDEELVKDFPVTE